MKKLCIVKKHNGEKNPVTTGNSNELNISVVIPSYNNKDLLKETLGHLFSQIYPKDKFEIIVIDDGSSDGTEEIVKKISEKSPCQLKYYRQENKGPGAARNHGVKKSKYDIIMFMDSDILFRPDSLERAILMFKENGLDMYGMCPLWDSNTRLADIKNSQLIRHFSTPGALIPTGCLLINKKKFYEIGGFPEDFYFGGGEDMIFSSNAKIKGLKIYPDPKNCVIHNEKLNMRYLIKTGIRYGRAAYIQKCIYKKKSFPNAYIKFCHSLIRQMFRNAGDPVMFALTFIEMVFTHHGFLVESLNGGHRK